MIKLETKRLIIRDHVPEDLLSHHELMSNDIVMNYLQDIKTNSLEESRENLRVTMAEIDDSNRSLLFLKVVEKETNAHVGEIGYTVTKCTNAGRFVHLGYFSYEKFWKKGYITEALKKIISFAFEQDNVSGIATCCHAENIGSQKVLENCGMKKDKDYCATELHNEVEKERLKYCLLKNEWNMQV